MPRNLDAATISELTSSVVRPRFFLEIELDTGSTLNYWTGEQDISWNSKTWLANGFFKSFDQITESKDGGFEGVSVDLVGEPSAIISTILNSVQRYRRCDLYFGFVSESNAVIASPTSFQGLIESVSLKDGVDEATVTIRATSHLAILEKSVNRRFNAQSQAIDYPNDLGFEYVEKLQDFNGVWAKFNKKKSKKNDPARENKNQNKKNKRGRT